MPLVFGLQKKAGCSSKEMGSEVVRDYLIHKNNMCRKIKKDRRTRFYEELKNFLVVNAIFVFIAMRGGNVFSWWWLPAFIWAVNLLTQYQKAFRSGDGFLPEGEHGKVTESPRRQREKEPKWKEKDLV